MTKPASIDPIDEHKLIVEALKENIPIEKYREIVLEIKKANYCKQELIKSVKFLTDLKIDEDTHDVNLEIIINKLMNAVKHELKAELIKENWRVS